MNLISYVENKIARSKYMPPYDGKFINIEKLIVQSNAILSQQKRYHSK